MEYKVPENPSENRIGSFTPLVAVSGLLIMLYLTANLMAVKVISIGPLALFDAGTITFPIAYMLSDVLAEIWGYRTAKKVIFLTFVCNILLVVFTSIGIILPYPDYMEEVQNAYATIYTYVPRIVIASLISFLAGDIMNAKILVAMRDRSRNGRNLWMRTIGSSAVGYLIDTVLFVLIAFTGTAPASDLLSMIAVQYVAKLGLALDEELIGVPRRERLKLVEEIAPAYFVLKPSLHGGFKGCEQWIDLAIMSDIHVLLAYIGFFGLTITYVYILFHYRIYDRRLSDILFKVMGAILVFILGLYLYFFGVNGFMEVIYLTAMITITLIIELDYARISTGNKR